MVAGYTDQNVPFPVNMGVIYADGAEPFQNKGGPLFFLMGRGGYFRQPQCVRQKPIRQGGKGPAALPEYRGSFP
jgi:hypothetical protein